MVTKIKRKRYKGFIYEILKSKNKNYSYNLWRIGEPNNRNTRSSKGGYSTGGDAEYVAKLWISREVSE